MKWLFTILLFAAHGVSYCQTQSEFNDELEKYITRTVPIISVYDLSKNLEDYIILDSREKDEYLVSHIENAIHVGYDNFDLESIKNIEKDKRVVVYCSIGYRSEKIGEKLLAVGFKNVYNLYGSLFAWVNEGYPVVDDKNIKTSKIHTYNRSWSKWVMNDQIEKIW